MYYELVIIAFLITLVTQLKIKADYQKYLQVIVGNGLTGYEVARQILDHNGLENVKIRKTQGLLSDYYNSGDKTVNLSADIYSTRTVTALSVAAHECGHALQDKEGYGPLKVRSAMVPIVNFSSYMGYIAITIGIIASLTSLIYVGIILECVILLFELVTLPVEFDASARALKELRNYNLTKNEAQAAKQVLRSAAFTYVASVANTALQILRLVLIFGNRRRD